jgi:prepilin-type N-terminal cleavage/methylation domain-containing protein
MMKNNPRAFTLFELLAVLTVSGVLFMVILGSYNSWAAVHACNGTARVMKAGLHQAQTLARAKNRYTIFEFGTHATNKLQNVSQFQIYICTNTTADIEQLLNEVSTTSTIEEQNTAFNAMGVAPAAPPQPLSNHIRLSSMIDNPTGPEEVNGILFFRPDGSVWSGYPDNHYYFVMISSRQLFDELPLQRAVRIDLTTGAVELLREENIR